MPEHANFLSENLIAIAIGGALLALLLTLFIATGRRKPRRPMRLRGGGGQAASNRQARGEEAAIQTTGSIVKRRQGAQGHETTMASGAPSFTGMLVIALAAVVAIGAGGLIVFSIG